MTKGKSLDGVHAELRQRIELLLEAVPGLYVSSAFRSYAEQKRLYDGWKAGKKGFAPANKPGTSMHEKGLAVDVATDTDRLSAKRATVARQLGLHTPHKHEPWHFELAPSRKPLDLRIAPVVAMQVSTTEKEVDMRLTTIEFANVTLDKKGNGWVPVDAEAKQILDITQQGSYPPADDYWNICQFAKQDRNLGPGKRSIVQISGGKKNQTITFWVQVAA